MNLELPVFDGFRCHYRLLRVQVKLISELVNGCLKEKFMFRDWSIFYSNHKIFSSSTTSPMFLVVHLFKLKDNHQMFCYGVSVSGKLSRLLKGRFSGLLSLSSSDEEGSRCKLQVPSSSKVLRMQYNVFQFFAPGSQVWCFVGFEGSKLWVHHWFHNRVSG
ncbi:BnaC02g25640D [Brassica napus]|uniref:BnaC02g25640D protein n=1 Tax=Brassica napus TaxID=3708 RepID=A0A078G719_BRANA|nr:BnaC02g25640D [Brassica napus]